MGIFVKVVAAAIGIIVLITAINGYRTKRRLVQYCRETTGGTTLAAARQKAAQQGFRFIDSSSADNPRRTALVTASGVMGRVVCEVEHDGIKVLKASLHGND